MHSAGVIVHDGKGRLLLGLQRDGWSSFSGKAEEGETPRQTAVRECAEETLHTLLDAPFTIGQTPLLTSVTPSGRTFYLFEGRLPYDPDIERRFASVRSSGVYATHTGCQETRRVRWYRTDSLDRVRLRSSFHTDAARIVAAIRPTCEAHPTTPQPHAATVWPLLRGTPASPLAPLAGTRSPRTSPRGPPGVPRGTPPPMPASCARR